jgi:SAM-dependent methyltransferase
METPKEFVEYYAEQSLADSTLERFSLVADTIIRIRGRQGRPTHHLVVGDVGCAAGTQSIMWARQGHEVHGVDISTELVELGRKRSAEEGVQVDFQVSDAAQLPWEDESIDVCLVPELLEHVAEWAPCLDEFARVLRPGGTLHLSTTNRLCPVQQEFDLPLYSWYPNSLKKRYEKLSVTTRPELVSHARFPAVHWFTFYQLKQELSARGLVSQDRFDVIDMTDKGFLGRAAINLIRSSALARRFGHVLTPFSVVFATKPDRR